MTATCTDCGCVYEYTVALGYHCPRCGSARRQLESDGVDNDVEDEDEEE